MNDFSPFPADILVRINPDEMRKQGRVPTNGSIFFTIFPTFMTGKENTPSLAIILPTISTSLLLMSATVVAPITKATGVLFSNILLQQCRLI